jgi:uncharacterized protein YbaP (TraB family)
MINRLLLLLTILISTLSHAQNTYQGLLWKISGNGLEKPSFLYGTMHVSNKVAFHLSDSFYKAIESVDVVSLEINPETWMETMTSNNYIADRMGNVFSVRGDYANSGLYKAIFELEKPENKEIGDLLASELGILNSLLYRTSNYSADFQEDTYLDLFIFQTGKKQGKQITGVEQLGTTMRLGEEAAKPEKDKAKKKAQKELAEQNRHKVNKMLDGKAYGEAMEDAYRRGDLDWLDSLSRLSSSNEKYHDLIIVKRNEGMAQAMDSIMQKSSLFAGVGAAHLPNSYGVINLLREMGYTVSPVSTAKSDYGTKTKDRLEETFIEHQFTKRTSFDGRYSTYMPGPLYEFPESNHTMMAAFPDMGNGATYVVTRFQTFAPLFGISQEDYISKIDSLLFENIPGKIIENDRITVNGVPGINILNKTKKGDFQRYNILVTPNEILVFKVGGKKEFVKRKEVSQFFDKLEIHNAMDWSEYAPKNNAYNVELPGNLTFEAENNSFIKGYWNKTVQSFSANDGFFVVLNRSYADLDYMEEDSFEISQMCKNFVQQLGYKTHYATHDSFQSYISYSVKAEKENQPNLALKGVVVGKQYYLFIGLSNKEESVSRFFSSIKLNNYKFFRPSKLQKDSARLFTVNSSVEPPPEINYYDYYGGGDSEEDDSHEEEIKSAVYYNKESDEAIYVRYKKFHKYYFENHIDSIWSENRDELLEDDEYFIRSENKTEEAGIYTYEIEVGDTNSGRNFYAKHILKEGLMYSLFCETDYRAGKSEFVREFYSSFTPMDSVVGSSVLENKVGQYFSDLISEDSITREAAFNSFYTLNFEDEDAPKLMSAYKDHYSGEHGPYIRTQILSQLGYLEHPEILPFLTKTYQEIGDSVNFQLPILTAISRQRTRKSAKLFSALVSDETPLSNDDDEIDDMFYPYYDSLSLAKELYPKVLRLSALPEYKSSIYGLLATMVDSNVFKPRRYRKYVNQLVWEANNEVKRRKASESYKGNNYFKEASRGSLYNYNQNLMYYSKMLMPFYRKSKVKKYYERIEKLSAPGLRMDLAVLKLQNGHDVPQKVWDDFATNTNDRIEIYQKLKEIDRLDLFPKQYTMQDLVEGLFAQYNYVNVLKDSQVFITKKYAIVQEDTGYIYFFKSKSSYDEDWTYGYIGVFDTTNMELKRWGYEYDDDFRFSKYEDEDLQFKMQVRMLEMQDRPRYKVSDEPEFKDLKSKRPKYYY